MNRIRKLVNRINTQTARRLGMMTLSITLHTVVAIALFNLLGQGVIAHLVTLVYFWGMLTVLDAQIEQEIR